VSWGHVDVACRRSEPELGSGLGIGAGSLLTGRLVSKSGRTTVFPVFGLALVTANLVVLAV
jgi:hypothetical protein